MPRAPGDLPRLACPHQRAACPAASLRPRLTFLVLIVSQICFPVALLMVILGKASSSLNSSWENLPLLLAKQDY